MIFVAEMTIKNANESREIKEEVAVWLHFEEETNSSLSQQSRA